MGYSEPTGKAFICDLITLERYEFQFMPESLSDSKGSNWADYSILGRSSPLKGYQNSPSRVIEVTLVLFAAPIAGNSSPTPAQVNHWKDFLISLPYPDYKGGGIRPPHKCLIKVGDGYAMQGLCTNASAGPMAKTPWELGPGYPHGQTVSMRFEEIVDSPLSVDERRNGSYGG